jgi:hypothetical protein
MSEKEDLNKKAKELDDIYRDYLNKLNKLSQKQVSLIKDFIKTVEAKKLEDIRKQINK